MALMFRSVSGGAKGEWGPKMGCRLKTNPTNSVLVFMIQGLDIESLPGNGGSAVFPAAQRFHNLEGLSTFPPKRHAMPTMAIGNGAPERAASWFVWV